jgi:hypothetical protein
MTTEAPNKGTSPVPVITWVVTIETPQAGRRITVESPRAAPRVYIESPRADAHAYRCARLAPRADEGR